MSGLMHIIRGYVQHRQLLLHWDVLLQCIPEQTQRKHVYGTHPLMSAAASMTNAVMHLRADAYNLQLCSIQATPFARDERERDYTLWPMCCFGAS